MIARPSPRSCMRVVLMLSFGALLACNPNRGYRSLALVQKDAARLRSRVVLDLESSLVFPRCTHRPSQAYVCGLTASRQAERDIELACGEPRCARQKLEALYGAVRRHAEQLGVDLHAVELRCGDTCRDLRALELEMLRTSGEAAAARSDAAHLRADSTEREALEREREKKDIERFSEEKADRDRKLTVLLGQFRSELLEAERDGASLPHASLCGRSDECAADATCIHFRGASVGLCEKE